MKVYLLKQFDDYDDDGEETIINIYLYKELAEEEKKELDRLEVERRVEVINPHPYKIWYDIEERDVIE